MWKLIGGALGLVLGYALACGAFVGIFSLFVSGPGMLGVGMTALVGIGPIGGVLGLLAGLKWGRDRDERKWIQEK